jgi:hypothetical protein
LLLLLLLLAAVQLVLRHLVNDIRIILAMRLLGGDELLTARRV